MDDHDSALYELYAGIAMLGEMVTTFSDATPEAAEEFVKGMKKHGHTCEQHLAFNAHNVADAMMIERARRLKRSATARGW
jgi:hypothetical protein